jgi:anti-sigma factor RsiW
MIQSDLNTPACAVCASLLPDAVEGILTPAEQAAFDKHVAGCVECARELAEARRGAAWLSLLKSQAPEPPPALLARILSQTTGAETAGADYAAPVWMAPAPARTGLRAQWFAFTQQLSETFSMSGALQPRMAMTAAMAFFSIALTLNLTGVRLSNVRADNFTPSGLRRAAADLSASATRSFQNSRVVYQVESRVSELNDSGPLDNRQPH